LFLLCLNYVKSIKEYIARSKKLKQESLTIGGFMSDSKGVDLTIQIYDFDSTTGRIVKQYGINGVLTVFDMILRAFKTPDFDYRKIKNEATGEIELETEKDRFGREVPKRIIKEQSAADNLDLGQLLFRLQTHAVLRKNIELNPKEIATIKKIVGKQFPDAVLFTQICDTLDQREQEPKTPSATKTIAELYEAQEPIEYEITMDSLVAETDPVKLKNIIRNVLMLLNAEKSERAEIRQFLKKVASTPEIPENPTE